MQCYLCAQVGRIKHAEAENANVCDFHRKDVLKYVEEKKHVRSPVSFYAPCFGDCGRTVRGDQYGTFWCSECAPSEETTLDHGFGDYPRYSE